MSPRPLLLFPLPAHPAGQGAAVPAQGARAPRQACLTRQQNQKEEGTAPP